MAGEDARLDALVGELRGVIDAQAAEILALKEQNQRLEKLLEEVRRAGKRQASPFSEG